MVSPNLMNPPPQHRFRGFGGISAGDQDDRRFMVFRLDLADRFDAMAVEQTKIDDYQVKASSLQCFEGMPGCSCMMGIESLMAQNVFETFQQRFVIFENQGLRRESPPC